MAKRPPIVEYRSAIAALKRAGLLARGIDARKAQPSRNLNAAIKRFKSVIEKKATTVPLSKVNLREREIIARGMQLSKPAGGGKGSAKIIVPKYANEKVVIQNPPKTKRGADKAGNIMFVSPEGTRGITRIELPAVRTDTVNHFFGDIKRALPKKKEGYLFAAQYMGGRTVPYANLHDLINTVHGYDFSVSADTPDDTKLLIRNFALIRLPDNESSSFNAETRKNKANRAKAQRAKANKARRNSRH